MNIFKATLDTRHQNGVIGNVTQFDHATLELQILSDGQVGEAWESPKFELIAMKRDMNSVREVDQDRFTILSKEDHKVQIELKEQFLTCRGTVKMQLVVKDGSRLSTTLFYLVIGQSLDHDIVASYRDAKVLDDLDSLNQQAYDDLAFREQRYEEMEDSFTELNGKMNANEAERNKAEITRQKTFDINEAHRTRTFNNQVEEQGVAFSNAQTQRDESFIESQQNMSQEFETSQRERESAFNELQKSNQKTFETNEQKRQTTFSQSQGANKQTFTQNETDRQRIFESNESDRQESESQRVQNELERVKAETQRAEAEVTRQQKMTDFEEKATQLSEDLDNQVARVDEFVSANEEKLLGAHDKTDYMGNAHKSVKDVNDANVEYILGEVNTVHYEGQHITATDTIEKQVRSAILKGVTKGQQLLNSLLEIGSISGGTGEVSSDSYRLRTVDFISINPDETYTAYAKSINVRLIYYYSSNKTLVNTSGTGNVEKTLTFKTPSNCSYIKIVYAKTNLSSFDDANYEVGLQNGDTYYETLTSVKMPVLTTTGRNLIGSEIIAGWLNTSNGEINNLTSTTTCATKDLIKVKPATHYSIYKEYDKRVLYAQFNEKQEFINFGTYTHNGFTTDSNAMYVRWFFETPINEELKVMLYEGGYNSNISYEPYRSNILTVNEEVELRGIGDLRDTLDCLTGEVTERIGEIIFDGSEEWYSTSKETDNYIMFRSSPFRVKFIPPICDRFKTYSTHMPNITESNGELLNLQTDNNCFQFIIKKEKLSSNNVEGFKQWLSQNPTTVQYQLATESIKTVDLSGQKVYSYDGTTHYSCSAAEGALIPTLSIDVPTNLSALVSRQRTTIESQKEQIITLEQENEQLIAQNEVQDIDISLNQDAINFMLFAPTAMSLAEQTKGVNTMAAYLANQILKGRLDYTLVVSRYGEFKEDIDTILISEGKQDLIK